MARTCDILVSGGGVAGLTAAAVFGAAGFEVVCVDPTQPVTSSQVDGADLRTTAFLQPSRILLDQCGLWQNLAPHATPLSVMRIVDAGGPDPEPRVIRDFDSADVSDEPFGWNLPNWLIRREILSRVEILPTVTFLPGVATTSYLGRLNEARVGLSDGSQIRAKLVIAADGRDSPMRKAAGIGVQTTRYGQMALVCAVTHSLPHQNVSTEIHRTGGPFTLVPLPDLDGQPCSALVWMEDGPTVRDLMTLDVNVFSEAMTERSCNLYGPLGLASPRQSWPIISQQADRLTGCRLALMAEAAHVVPPIGAQGLNMSLADLQTLLDLARAAPEDLGSDKMLSAYERSRKADVTLRVTGIDLLNRASQTKAPPLRDARALGMRILHDVPPLRRTLMKLGLGLR